MVTFMPVSTMRRTQRHDGVDAGDRLLEAARDVGRRVVHRRGGAVQRDQQVRDAAVEQRAGQSRGSRSRRPLRGDVDRAIAELARQVNGVDEARVQGRLAAVDVELIGALVAVLAQDRVDLVPVEGRRNAIAGGTEHAPVGALVGDVHDQLAAPRGPAIFMSKAARALATYPGGQCGGS